MVLILAGCLVFFFNDTATTEIYTLSLHDALPIFRQRPQRDARDLLRRLESVGIASFPARIRRRSEEHTSELQSHLNLVCRLLLEKKKKRNRQSRRIACLIAGYLSPRRPPTLSMDI